MKCINVEKIPEIMKMERMAEPAKCLEDNVCCWQDDAWVVRSIAYKLFIEI